MLRTQDVHAARAVPVPPRMPTLRVATEHDAQRAQVQQYIAGVFKVSYGAHIREFMPVLVSLEGRGDGLSAALGLRGASRGELFCEQYLDAPVETFVRDRFDSSAGRGQVLEMGQLVGSVPGYGSLLYTLVGAAMCEAGVRYLVFVANRAVRISLMRSGLRSVAIAPARQERLGPAGTNWGSYYSGDPHVMLGDVHGAMAACMTKPAVRQLLSDYDDSVDELVDVIRARLL
jgi:hypothetical protein